MTTPAIATLADLSMIMWRECHRRGISASVRLSKHSRASRYLTIAKMIVVRLSDHGAPPENDVDFEIVIRNGDDLKRKRRDALALFEQILAAQPSVAA